MKNKLKLALAILLFAGALTACTSSSEKADVAQDEVAADTTAVAPADTTATESADTVGQ